MYQCSIFHIHWRGKTSCIWRARIFQVFPNIWEEIERFFAHMNLGNSTKDKSGINFGICTRNIERADNGKYRTHFYRFEGFCIWEDDRNILTAWDTRACWGQVSVRKFWIWNTILDLWDNIFERKIVFEFLHGLRESIFIIFIERWICRRDAEIRLSKKV